MKKYEVLTQLENGDVKLGDAYNMLYPKMKERKARKAHFVKVSVRIPEERGVNVLLKILLALPIPIVLIKMILKRRGQTQISDQIPVTMKEILDLISIKGAMVNVHASDRTRVSIKTI